MLIDLNADLGEGAGTDADLMPLVTSANISCGFHAGDPETVIRAIELASQNGVRVGAHPGYHDREHAGRRELPFERDQLLFLGLQQFGALRALADWIGVPVTYVKPHGALYHQVCRERPYADGFMHAVYGFFNPSRLPVVGLPGSVLHSLVTDCGSPFIPEGFADRRYRPDGSLVPRTEPDAILHDVKEVVAQVEWLVREKGVRTICVHGDTPGAVEFVRAVRAALQDAGHELRAFA
jgi:5-oxoprolinase (ATP-hydrolysing) subunit A